MNLSIKQAVTVFALCCFLCGVGSSQESLRADADLDAPIDNDPGHDVESDAGSDEAAFVDEEIIVRGRSRARLRMQFELAEDAVYQRFNEINSDDEFDIHCRLEVRTGTRMPQRVCQSNFWREAQAAAGQETARGLQGGASLSPQLFLGEALYKRQLFEEELQRLAREDEQLLQSLVVLENIKLALEEKELPLPSSTYEYETTAGEEPLPYEAARITEVRIMREPWSDVLTYRTFAIANVYGELRSVEVDCDERTQRLRWEAGVEWTLPEDWGSCTLLVEAPPRTTFSLYEFDDSELE